MSGQRRVLDVLEVRQVQAPAQQRDDHASALRFPRPGQAGAPSVEGTAELATLGPDFDAIQAKVRAKYGFMVTMSHFFNTLGHLGKGPFPYGDVGVVVTLTDQS